MFRRIDLDLILRGTILAIVEFIFPGGAPSVKEYSQETGVAGSTFQRTARWLLGLLPRLLKGRRPGPREVDAADRQAREEALRKLEDLRSWLRENRKDTEKNACYSGEAKQRIASLSEEIQASGVLSFAEIAGALGIHERQLYRIRKELEARGGEAPQPKSRRPHRTEELSPKIQELIRDIQASADSRRGYTAMDVKRILQRNYKEKLRKYHGSETIAYTTVRKYMKAEARGEEEREEHPRGSYRYPEPFQQVAVDTSYFKLFGRTFYFITVLELSGRLNLVTRVFLRERTEEVVTVLEEYLASYPGVEVTVIDRGRPYLNAEVKALLEGNGRLRVVCPPRTPTAKAALERHFHTLKPVIRGAIEKVFPEDPGWEPQKLVKALEMGVAVFQELYHQIPQEGIDGKCPAERIQEFDPVRASARMIDLFERSLNSEPAEEYAREIHRRFQLPGKEGETVKRLRQFGTRALRRAVEEVSPYMGPPHPNWMYDPLGYLATKAREIYEKERREYNRRRFEEEQQNQRREDAKTRKEKREAEARDWVEHPERFVDGYLESLVNSVERNSPVARILIRKLRELLVFLSRKLGRAFSNEVARLKARVLELSENGRVRQTLENLLDDLARELSPVRTIAGG